MNHLIEKFCHGVFASACITVLSYVVGIAFVALIIFSCDISVAMPMLFDDALSEKEVQDIYKTKEAPARFHCITKVTYRHWVRGTRCPSNSNEVVLGSLETSNGVPYVECGKFEADCYTRTK